MKNATSSIAGIVTITVASLIVATNLGLVGIDWPWERLDLPSVNVTESTVGQAAEAQIIEVVPLTLDCRARIQASVPVEGRREHRVLGQVYRTDKVTMVAAGDIDTCVDATRTRVTETVDGTFTVVVPAEAISFERPRVDAGATASSVETSKGLVGRLSDVLPWVDDASGLTPAAYAYAQDVVGSGDCMEQAWNVTEAAVRQAYGDQIVARGGSREDVTVVIDGAPSFAPPPPTDLDGFEFTVDEAAVVCTVDDGLETAAGGPTGLE